MKKDHTLISAALLVTLLISLGGFLGYHKSHFIPTKVITFLGFELNSITEEVAIPQDKYEKTMAQIDEFLAQPMVDVKARLIKA